MSLVQGRLDCWETRWPIKKNSVSMIKSLNLGISLFPEQDAESG